MANEFDPLMAARESGQFAQAIQGMGRQVEQLYTAHLDFSGEVLRRLSTIESMKERHDEDRHELHELEKDFAIYRKDTDTKLVRLETQFKIWAAVAASAGSVLGGWLVDYLGKHIR